MLNLGPVNPSCGRWSLPSSRAARFPAASLRARVAGRPPRRQLPGIEPTLLSKASSPQKARGARV